MVRLRDATDTSTLFQFEGPTKILMNGSLSPRFKGRIKRNPRLKALDILHKKGINNRIFMMKCAFHGADKWTDEAVLSALAQAQTTVYLDTEGINDDYNGTYLFIDDYFPDYNAKQKTLYANFKLIQFDN